MENMLFLKRNINEYNKVTENLTIKANSKH